MREGTVLADRFEVEALAGEGGVGAVYRAVDRATGALVAVKVLRVRGETVLRRFSREAQVLAEVRHPGLVRYVADGVTPAGEAYLVTEWLEGEDLGQRLARGPLSVRESVVVATRAAEALAALHARGFVHRDIKPSNLFVVGGALDDVRVLDLGVAHSTAHTTSLTRTGSVLGTPGYMAPEQARGDRDVGPRADVFSLGCVLFECLTGAAPFYAENVIAVLAKVLLEPAPRPSDVVASLPRAVDDLVAAMMAKDPADRPADARAVVAALGRVARDDARDGAEPGSRASQPDGAALTGGEQRLVSIVLLRGGDEAPAGDALAGLAAAVEPLGQRVERLADGTVLVMVSGGDVATDLATRAARCAVALRDAAPGARVVVATGRAQIAGRLPVGAAIDRAAEMLRACAPDTALVDDVTAGLLDARFELAGTPAGLALRDERPLAVSARKLLGRPTPCVGRERDLRLLEELYDDAVDNGARVALVTAAAGVGKSRLLHELLARLRAREAEAPEVWVARGDPMRAGSAFGMLAQLVRGAAASAHGEPPELARRRLRARLSRYLAGDALERAAVFLGTLAGIPIPAEAHPQLRVARGDPMVMHEQMRDAWGRWLAAETAARPLLIVLEDLQWGDLPTVRFVDAALRDLRDRPLMVLALARPEVRDAFPDLWAARDVTEVRLVALSRRASEALARAVLGDGAPADVIARVVERAGGNAFYLEELLRAVAREDGSDATLPPTVLAMAQTRLERLEPQERQVLRAASVFGQVFWTGGVRALLGAGARATPSLDLMEALAERELVERRDVSRFPREAEYAFRHALLREAAYATLTDADRALGHRLAGEWLERAGETDALVLAEHFERGGQPARAVAFYCGAAEQAIEGNDLGAALARAERGIACGASGEELGALRLVQTEVHIWRSEPEAGARTGAEAFALLRRASSAWYRAAAELLMASVQVGDLGQIVDVMQALQATSPEGAAAAAYVQAAAIVAAFLLDVAQFAASAELVDAIERVAATDPGRDPAVGAWVEFVRLHQAGFVRGDVAGHLGAAERAAELFAKAGDLRTLAFARMQVGFAAHLAGDAARADAELRAAEADAGRLQLRYVAARARLYRASLLADAGAAAAARVEAEAALATFAAARNTTMIGSSRAALARALHAAGDAAGAEREASLAVDELLMPSMHRAEALAALAVARVARGDAHAALEVAREGTELLEALGAIGYVEPTVRLAHAEALLATGDVEGSRAAAASAVVWARARAAALPAAMRAGFLARREHARARELAGA